jgi:hypothetical protein
MRVEKKSNDTGEGEGEGENNNSTVEEVNVR